MGVNDILTFEIGHTDQSALMAQYQVRVCLAGEMERLHDDADGALSGRKMHCCFATVGVYGMS